MGPADTTLGVAMPATHGPPMRARRSRKKRRVTDPTAREALPHVRPSDDRVRAYLADIAATADRGLRVGLLAAKVMDSPHPPHDLASRMRHLAGVELTTRELRALASNARLHAEDALYRRFECRVTWRLRWLPRIEV